MYMKMLLLFKQVGKQTMKSHGEIKFWIKSL